MGSWVRSFQGRWLNAALLAVVLVVIGVQFANPHSYVSEAVARIGETGSGPDAKLADLTNMCRRRPLGAKQHPGEVPLIGRPGLCGLVRHVARRFARPGRQKGAERSSSRQLLPEPRGRLMVR